MYGTGGGHWAHCIDDGQNGIQTVPFSSTLDSSSSIAHQILLKLGDGSCFLPQEAVIFRHFHLW